MTFDPFKPLTPEQVEKKDQATKEYLRRRRLIFNVFTTPQGKELLQLMRSVTVDRPFSLPSPKSVDDRVAFENAYAKKEAVDGFVKQLLAQIRQEEEYRSRLTDKEKKDG